MSEPDGYDAVSYLPDPVDSGAGGFSIPGPNFKDSAHFRASTEDGFVDFHVQLSGNGHGVASIYQRLTPEQALELSLLLEQQAAVAAREGKT